MSVDAILVWGESGGESRLYWTCLFSVIAGHIVHSSVSTFIRMKVNKVGLQFVGRGEADEAVGAYEPLRSTLLPAGHRLLSSNLLAPPSKQHK